MSWSAQPAGDSKIQAASSSRYGPQSPAHQSTLSTMPAGRKSTDERLLRISGDRPHKPRRTRLAVCTYNTRTLTRDEQLYLLMEEKKKFTCDILGVCETRRRSGKEVKWNDGHMIYLGSGSGPRSVGGIGFIINKKWSSKIMSCSIQSARIGTLMLKLDAKKTIKIVQIYAPTNAAEDWEVEEFYQELGHVAQSKVNLYGDNGGM